MRAHSSFMFALRTNKVLFCKKLRIYEVLEAFGDSRMNHYSGTKKTMSSMMYACFFQIIFFCLICRIPQEGGIPPDDENGVPHHVHSVEVGHTPPRPRHALQVSLNSFQFFGYKNKYLANVSMALERSHH